MTIADTAIAIGVLAASSGWYAICSKRAGGTFGAGRLRFSRSGQAPSSASPQPCADTQAKHCHPPPPRRSCFINAERPAMPCPNPGRHKAGQGWRSLSTRGAWGQVAIAATLISVLPSLILLWLWETRDTGSLPLGFAILAGCLGLALGILGYTLLLKYPASITRLRRYLQDIALDRLPDRVELCHDEDDINAIRQCMEQIVVHAKERIRLLEEKQAATLAAERHRIMHESIGALCHHVGQPAAALGITLHLMQQGSPPPPLAALIAESQQSFNAMTDILDRLRDLTHYQTEPYLVSDPAGPRIIRVPSGNISDSKPVTLPTTDLTKPVSPARLRDLVSSRSVTG